MNTPKPSKMPYVIIAIVVFLAAVIYFYWNGNQIPTDAALSESEGNQIVGARVFKLLGEINNIRIDTSFFKDSSYQTLRDFSVDIPPLPIGRPNPFAPVPGVTAPGAGGSTGTATR